VKEAWFGPAVDDAGWAEVRSDRGSGWESQGFANYTGVAWYRQRVVVPAELAAAERLYLLFAAVDEDAEVWVNGEKAFTHTCEATGLAPEAIWTTPFAFDVRPLLKEGENLVAVRVNNRQGMGGIWKPAYFVTTDADADARLLLTAIDAGE
jgi:beta-galactosidase/beta-glucuronidase